MMNIAFASWAFAAAALCAGVMGFAIQRGGTCTVAAVDEVISSRRFSRITALAEASLWVAGGLAIAHALQWPGMAPGAYAVTQWTVVGGVLLGLGAHVNRACVFGTIARFGSGEWAYLATPLGFYAGCASVGRLFGHAPAVHVTASSPVLEAATFSALAFTLFAAWRLARHLPALRSTAAARKVASRVWSPHAATSVIGITFLLMLLLVGNWAYTDALAELALAGMSASLAAKLALMLALLAGAWWGGRTAGRFNSTRIGAALLARCFTGGLLMGWGSLLIPGGNDGLILAGMPLLRPYAWLAFGTMCVTIAAALLLARQSSHFHHGRNRGT